MSCSDQPDCSELRAHLYELVDVHELAGTACEEWLDSRSRTLLEAHVAQCPECLDALGAEIHVRELIKRCYASQERAPESLRLRIVTSTTMSFRA